MAKGEARLGFYVFGSISESNGFEAVMKIISSDGRVPSKVLRRSAASRAEAETVLRSLAIEVMKDIGTSGGEVHSVHLDP